MEILNRIQQNAHLFQKEKLIYSSNNVCIAPKHFESNSKQMFEQRRQQCMYYTFL
jgi:hypothetical protein